MQPNRRRKRGGRKLPNERAPRRRRGAGFRHGVAAVAPAPAMGEEQGERGEAGGNYKSRQAVPRSRPTSPLPAAPGLKRKRRRGGLGRRCALGCLRRGERGWGLRRGRGIVRGAGPSLGNPTAAGPARPGRGAGAWRGRRFLTAVLPELWRRGGPAAGRRGAGVFRAGKET